MNEHRDYNIGIDKEKSPDYANLFEESDKLMESLNKLHQKLLTFKLSKLRPFNNWTRINKLIKEDGEAIYKPFDEWNDRAYNFLYCGGKYTVYAQDELSHIVASVQATNAISIRINQINTKGRDVKYDFYRLMDMADTLKVFWFTYLALILAVFFGLTGLIIGLISLLH
jgi:hypothetical protein